MENLILLSLSQYYRSMIIKMPPWHMINLGAPSLKPSPLLYFTRLNLYIIVMHSNARKIKY